MLNAPVNCWGCTVPSPDGLMGFELGHPQHPNILTYGNMVVICKDVNHCFSSEACILNLKVLFS